MNNKRLLMSLLAVFTTTSVHAQAIDYTFTVENVVQSLQEVVCSQNADNQTVCFSSPETEVPIGTPVYPTAPVITGSLTYNPSASGFMGTPAGLPQQEPVPSVAIFLGAPFGPSPITNLVVNVNSDTYTRNITAMAFSDETTPLDPNLFIDFIPQDSLNTLGLPFPQPVVVPIVESYEGNTFTSNTPSFLFREGNETGFNFYPDIALADSPDLPGFPGPPTSATLPGRLPPKGAAVSAFSLSFSGSIDGTDYIYRIRGDLIMTPVIPVPADPPPPSPLPVEIEVNPFADNNEVYPNSDNPIVVNVISSSTVNGEAVDFDTSKIDPESLEFGVGAAPNVAIPWPWDHNGDYNFDDTFAFKTQATGILCNDTEVTLTGETYSGQVFEGTGTIDASDCLTGFCHPLF